MISSFSPAPHRACSFHRTRRSIEFGHTGLATLCVYFFCQIRLVAFPPPFTFSRLHRYYATTFTETKNGSNMAIMDITDIEPLLMAVYELLQESGIFVFATQHPCFVTLTEKYMTPHSYYDIAIEGQPKEQIYYHRSIQDIFNLCFRAGFVIDGFYEECFKTNKEIPMVMIVRLKKVKRDSLK